MCVFCNSIKSTVFNLFFSFFVIELITWGRKMGKRLEVLRRSESRDSLDSLSSRDSVNAGKQPVWPLGQPSSTADKSSTLKGFFTRIGSTGMLSYSRLYSNSFREKLQRSRERQAASPADCQLYRSVSTSHLATSYMKGDDPADCLDRGEPRTHGDDDDDDDISGIAIESPAEPGYVPLKTRSCDNISRLGTKKPNFPYAFLRSRLSVLPEENNGNGSAAGHHHSRHLHRYSADVAPQHQQHLQQRSNADGGSSHEIVVTEELFKEMDGDREYRRVFSNLSSSNESGYDSDGPRTLDCTYQLHHQKAADEDSGFGDTKSLTTDSLNEFEEPQQQQQQYQHSDRPGGRHQCGGGSDKDYNVPSMCLFYKKNREINDRIRLDGRGSKDTPNFHRRMFVKNRSPPVADPSSLPADLNNLRSRMQIVRLLKSRYADDIGVYLKMFVKRVADYDETRFVVIKLEPGKIAYR